MNLNQMLSFSMLLLVGFVIGAFQGLADEISQPGLFSYQAPKGWTIKDTAMSKYKVCFDTPKNNFAANINVVVEQFSGTLAKYVELNEANLKGSSMFKNLQVVEDKPFTTASGVAGERVVITDTFNGNDLQQTFYFFAGTSDTKFVVTATCLAGDGATYAPTFDASVKTFSTK